MTELVVLCNQKSWLNQALTDMEQLPQPQRGPRRDNQQLLRKYYNLVVREITLNYRRRDQVLLNLYHIRREQVKRQLGKFTLGRRVIYWLHWFEQRCWSLYTIISQGNNINEENTQVKLNYDFLTDWELESIPVDMIIEHYDQLNQQQPDMVLATPVDLKSLGVFIERTRTALSRRLRYSVKQQRWVWASPEWLEAAENNLKTAVQIQRLSLSGNLTQPMKLSPYGRTYLSGINLQNCSREVRHAALGRCFSIDFSVCSTAWRLHEAQQIQSGFTACHTLRLIKNKQQFRQDLADIIGDRHLRRAKTVLTSIGFGATLSDSCWPSGQQGRDYEVPSLNKLLGEYEIEQLKSTPWFNEFIEEQVIMTKIITDDFIAQGNIPDCVKDRAGRTQRNKVMAYLYQQTEAYYLSDLIEYIIQRFGRDEILLPVHDCVYMRHSINMAEVNSRLLNMNPYLQAERTEHWGYFVAEDNPILALTAQDPHKQQAEAFLAYWRNRQQNNMIMGDHMGVGENEGYYGQ